MIRKIKLLILAIVIIVVFAPIRDFVIKSVLGTAIGAVTGAPVEIGGLSSSIVMQSVKITDFKMYNPKGFPKEDILVDIPKIAVAVDVGALFSGKTHVKKIDFELKEVGMIKNKEGRLNVDSLKIAGEKKDETNKPAKAMSIKIDVANLAIGKIVSKDYSVEGAPLIKVYDVNLKKSYKNITSVQELVILIITEPLKAAGIHGLKVYAASMLTGAAVLPVAAVFTLTGKDYEKATFKVAVSEAYDESLAVLKQMGKVKKENVKDGVINAEVGGAGVVLKLKKIKDTETEVTVSARQLGLPKPEIASGVIYQLKENLK